MKTIKSSGNVFTDIGFEKEEAENLLIRAKLMAEISKYVKDRQLTQSAAARYFGVSQPRISDLQRGKIGLFTVDTLITMLSKAGMNVNVRITKK
ncbi:MAG: XRE family transcriptional regulator [Nitrospinae bacterium]|nr:XRE family transcriptional regulator [Nitrospinota bacterium]